MAAHISNDADIGSNTSTLPLSTNPNNRDHGPESSEASVSPPDARNSPLDQPFRDGDASMKYYDPNGNDMHKAAQPGTAAHTSPLRTVTANLVDPVPTANADPVPVNMMPDDRVSPPPTLPARPSGLRRGLQIPSRVGVITWGFSLPKVLAEQGVNKPQWTMFSHELQAFAWMSKSQWVTVIACHVGIGHIMGYKLQKHTERENFLLAYQGGFIKAIEDRWNSDYFHPLGLQVRVEPSGMGMTDGMDVTSTKLFRYQQKMGISSPAPGVVSAEADKKEYKYQSQEGRYRVKAVRKTRIVVLPFSMVRPVSSQRETTGLESRNGQIEGTTARVESGTEGTRGTPTVAQRLASSRREQSSSEGLYRGRSEDDAHSAPSPARAPTTRWGGNR